MATSIETLLDLKMMSIEELSGRLLAVEENSALDSDDHSGRLLLTAEEWEARRKATRGNGASGSGGRKKPKGGKPGGGSGKPRGRDGGNGNNRDKCHYCGKKGHWKSECRKKKRDE